MERIPGACRQGIQAMAAESGLPAAQVRGIFQPHVDGNFIPVHPSNLKPLQPRLTFP